MKEMVDWIINKEERAKICYEKASALFKNNKELARLLNDMAADEQCHREVMGEAHECLRDRTYYPHFISLDGETMHNVEIPFKDLEESLGEGKITKKRLFELMVSIEFSEWNDVYLYIIQMLRDTCDFTREAPKLQQHRRRIERYIETDPELVELIERVKGFPPIWQERILVVDNSSLLVSLYSVILQKEGVVESVSNGEEALEKLKNHYFAAIITDVEMPVMDGREFYKRAVERYPNLKERILFCTIYDDTKNIDFFRKNNIRYMLKPVPIKEIRRVVVDIMNRPAG